MISALDHCVLICPDLQVGADTYGALLGRGPDWVSRPEDGAAMALFRLANTAIELMAPIEDGPVGDRLRQMLDDGGPRLTSLAFASDNVDADRALFERRALAPSDISAGQSTHAVSGDIRTWRRFRLSDAACAGVKTFVVGEAAPSLQADPAAEGAVTALDHIVIATPNPERAVAHYSGRLGLDFRLDRTAEQWNTRFLFFRTGGLTFEIIHRLGTQSDREGNDRIWGLTWAVDDLDAAHSRLSAAGHDLSEVRTGRKPGSRVFTVRDRTLEVPTLFIAHDGD
ncbi:MAG: VOC family protein [Pseudomonadota bacterium]